MQKKDMDIDNKVEYYIYIVGPYHRSVIDSTNIAEHLSLINFVKINGFKRFCKPVSWIQNRKTQNDLKEKNTIYTTILCFDETVLPEHIIFHDTVPCDDLNAFFD